MSNVYLIPAAASDSEDVLKNRVRKLWTESDISTCFSPRDYTAIKLHVGEPGTRTFLSPAIAAGVVDSLKHTGCIPFLTDTAVLYRSPRDNAIGHMKVAQDHGYTLEDVGAPFFPADGLRGDHGIDVRVDGRHHDVANIAAAILEARSVLVLSHATGHLGTGFGATLKNLGMGCCTRKAKLRQHHGQQPFVDAASCTACGACVQWCPSDAIAINSTALIDSHRCIGCGECVAVCVDGAIRYNWGVMGAELQERIVEHAAGVIRRQRDHIAYVTAAIDITRDCDCLGLDQKPLLKDIGLLASRDPVALDQAVHDLIVETTGCTLESMSYPAHDGTLQMRYAQSMGLGSTTYQLVKIPV